MEFFTKLKPFTSQTKECPLARSRSKPQTVCCRRWQQGGGCAAGSCWQHGERMQQHKPSQCPAPWPRWGLPRPLKLEQLNTHPHSTKLRKPGKGRGGRYCSARAGPWPGALACSPGVTKRSLDLLETSFLWGHAPFPCPILSSPLYSVWGQDLMKGTGLCPGAPVHNVVRAVVLQPPRKHLHFTQTCSWITDN